MDGDTGQAMKKRNVTSMQSRTDTPNLTGEEVGKRTDKDDHFAGLLDLDVQLTHFLSICSGQDSRYGILRTLAKFIEITGHGIPWLVLPICSIYVYGAEDSNNEFLVNLLFGLVLDLVIVVVIKAIVRRPRPAVNKMDMFATVSVDHYSFPSGHSSRAGMLLLLYLLEWTFLTWQGPVLMIVWSLSVCMSRLLLGRHHVSDVCAGIVLGFAECALLETLWIQTKQCNESVQYLCDFLQC
ncbi:polyisoprenoid diphosphate/phosphate phosphohydrolase PLPP6-like [Glandiceps talaboti]